MKRIIIGLALTTGVALVGAAPAQAAPKADPVKALKAQFTPGKGVTFSSVVRMGGSGETLITTRENGTIGFDKSGPAASDITFKMQLDPTLKALLEEEDQASFAVLAKPTRTISVKGKTYVSGSMVAQVLPEGKTWVRYTGAASTNRGEGAFLDVFEPATLKTLVAGASSYRNGVAKGTISTAKLRSVSRTFRSGGDSIGAKKITWALWINAKGQVTRVSAKMAVPMRGVTLEMTQDSRFSGWGAKVAISAPPSAQVVDSKDLGEDAPTPGLPDVLNEVKQ
ncbi:hypothetical protein [Nonomuraea africana]|uniref:LppX_LprAFG lipoprotein n=1 Tax=Nonomuraea africana TaxID=46171 RepID=A0ABR9KUW1_9ACTN|nr:hypothetical protein [Nonomuraea africana]MBE1565515.1 hypothetical protein [Nonomuraea africana]